MASIHIPNFPYRFATFKGKVLRSTYRSLLPWTAGRPFGTTGKISASVYSFSCERDLAEQVASIRSFISYVGIPSHFSVVSDGSYTPRSLRLLQEVHPCVRVVRLDDIVRTDVPANVLSYAGQHALGKKLAMVMSLTVTEPTIYIDSDVIFFEKGSELRELIKDGTGRPLYLLDSEVSLDRKLLVDKTEEVNPVNSGFFVIFDQLNWSDAVARLDRYEGKFALFTEQTMIHLAMHQTNAVPLDPAKYVCRRDDEFIYSDRYFGNQFALRHYVGPIRHKFWSFLCD